MVKDFVYYIMLKMDGKYYSLPPHLNDCYKTREEARQAAYAMGYHPEEVDVLEWEVD
jgi:hypothetical protein